MAGILDGYQFDPQAYGGGGGMGLLGLLAQQYGLPFPAQAPQGFAAPKGDYLGSAAGYAPTDYAPQGPPAPPLGPPIDVPSLQVAGAGPATDFSSANRPAPQAVGAGGDQNQNAGLFGGMFSGGASPAGPAPGAGQQPGIPAQAAAGPGIGDRLGAFWQGLGQGGLTSAVGGLATGQRQDPQGLLERALGQQFGLPPDVVRAAVKNPAYAPQLLGASAIQQALRSAGAPEAIVQSASRNPEVFKAVAPHYLGDQFKIVPFGATAIDAKGKVLYQNESGAALIDDKTADFMAHQYIAGDTSVMQNLGRGAQGAQNIVKLRQSIARLNGEEGSSAQEQAMRNAEFFGVKAGQRTLGTKQANIEMASTEFEQVLPIVMKASEAVNRTNYPTLNNIIQAYEKGTGDPNIVRFAGGVNTLINTYARAISPTGVGTVSDKEHARELLDKAWSSGQFDAAVGMMRQEIAAAKKSPGVVQQEMRDRFVHSTSPGGIGTATSGGAPSAPATVQQQGTAQQPQQAAPIGPAIKTKADFDKLPSGATYIDARDGKPYRKP